MSRVSFNQDSRCPKLGEGTTGIQLLSADAKLWGTFRLPETEIDWPGSALEQVVLVFIDHETDVPLAMRLCANQVVYSDDETSRGGFREAVFQLDPSVFVLESGTLGADSEAEEPEVSASAPVRDYRIVASIGRWTSDVVTASLRV